jgi:hypothetical protein
MYAKVRTPYVVLILKWYIMVHEDVVLILKWYMRMYIVLLEVLKFKTPNTPYNLNYTIDFTY